MGGWDRPSHAAAMDPIRLPAPARPPGAAFLERGEAETLAHAAVLPPEFAARLVAHPDPKVRAARARADGPDAGRQGLFAADPDARMRVLALRDPELAPALLDRLAADEDHTVRRSGVRRSGARGAAARRAGLDP